MTVTYDMTDFSVDSRGARLQGYLWRTAKASELVPVVVLSHGLTNNHEDAPLFDDLRRVLLDTGVDIVAFDYYGSGSSDGAFHDKTLSALRDNLGSVLSYVDRSICRRPSPGIALFGRSVGGTMCGFFSKHPAVACSVLASPPFDLVETFGHLADGADSEFVALPASLPPSGQIKGAYELPRTFFEELEQLTAELRDSLTGARRVLLMQAAADAKVAPGQAQALSGILGPDSVFHLLEEAGHNYEGFESRAVALTTDWLARVFNRDSTEAAS